MLSAKEGQVKQDSAAEGQAQTSQAPAELRKFPLGHPLGKFQQQPSHLKSPTDNIQSPASQKIEAKRGHLLSRIKPKSLTSQLAEVQNASGKKSENPSSDDPFA
ncbi:hypothetical protein DFS34DRAFT_684053 [Phlyctochytrium arcticum]|nr:hypothetical protein DFS34DRAFT_684053 [Phlyctochytrium arcticum]